MNIRRGTPYIPIHVLLQLTSPPVCVLIYIYIHMNACRSIYVNKSIYTFICIDMYDKHMRETNHIHPFIPPTDFLACMCVYMCIHVCIYRFIYEYTHLYIYICIHMYMKNICTPTVGTHSYPSMCPFNGLPHQHVHIYTYTCTYVRMYVYMYICMYVIHIQRKNNSYTCLNREKLFIPVHLCF